MSSQQNNKYCFKTTFKDYFLNLSLNEGDISLVIYNITLLDNIKYEIVFDLNDFKNLSIYFDTMDLSGIYYTLQNLITQSKIALEKKNNELVLSFLMRDLGIIDNNNTSANVQLILFAERDNNEYLCYLNEEAKKLRKKINELNTKFNNLSSQNQQLKNLNNKIHSQNILTPPEGNDSDDFLNNLDLDINDNIQELNVDKKLINDKIFPFLNKFELNKLIKLNLSYNRIVSIKGIENCKFPYLEIIKLNNNCIDDLTFISKAKFPELKKLWLYTNEISNICPLVNANFPKLDTLSLSNNDIKDISVLKNMNFPQIKTLNLDNNYINDISVFQYTKFKLENLGLNDNKIENVSVFEFGDFRQLTKLYLYYNSILDVSSFGRANLGKLKVLSLYKNKIKNISFLENPLLKELKELYLSDNQISDLSVFNRINIGFTKLYIDGNFFNADNNIEIINSLASKIEEFFYNKIYMFD